jgi:hypothetical protein
MHTTTGFALQSLSGKYLQLSQKAHLSAPALPVMLSINMPMVIREGKAWGFISRSGLQEEGWEEVQEARGSATGKGKDRYQTRFPNEQQTEAVHAPHSGPLTERHVHIVIQPAQHALLPVAARKLIACDRGGMAGGFISGCAIERESSW